MVKKPLDAGFTAGSAVTPGLVSPDFKEKLRTLGVSEAPPPRSGTRASVDPEPAQAVAAASKPA